MNKVKTLRTLRTIGVWIPLVLLAALFLMQGLMKLAPGSPWPTMFEKWGYPSGFHLVVGALELAGGVLLLYPRFSSHGSWLLMVVMFGAAATHGTHGEWLPNAAFTLGLAAVFGLLAYLRRSVRLGARRAELTPGEAPV